MTTNAIDYLVCPFTPAEEVLLDVCGYDWDKISTLKDAGAII